MLGRGEERPRKARRWTRIAAAVQGPPTVFLILRRMARRWREEGVDAVQVPYEPRPGPPVPEDGR